MSKGENIFKRRDGRWEARYIKGYELSGRIRYGVCYGKTYQEAKEKASRCKAVLNNGTADASARSRHRLVFYCGEWLREKKPMIREATYIKYDTILKRHILPRLGGCFPAAVTTGMIDAFARALLYEDGLAPKTVRDILTVLHDILRYLSEHCAGTPPAAKVNYPKTGRTEIRVLSREEQQNFISYLRKDMDACKFGILLALSTGVRIGELCALRWENISLADRTVCITAAMQRLRDTTVPVGTKTRVVIGPPKSETSVRMIPLPEHIVVLCKQAAPASPAAYVLTGTEHYMEPRVLQYRLKKYTTACGLEDVHFHTLRHTFATRAVEVGFEIKSLSEVLGHATTAITLERYVHSSSELKRINMDKLTAAGL